MPNAGYQITDNKVRKDNVDRTYRYNVAASDAVKEYKNRYGTQDALEANGQKGAKTAQDINQVVSDHIVPKMGSSF